jgi:hypothetical protein
MDTMQTARLMTAASGTNALRIGEQSKRGACAASRGRRLGGRSRSRPGVAADSARPGRAGKRSERMQSAAPLL